MSHLHRLFICLGIILELKYTTYALISAFILRFACFMFMCKIGLNKPKCMNRRTILRLCSSKRMAKVAQRHPMQTNCGNYHDPKHLRTMQQSEAQEQRSQRPPDWPIEGHHKPRWMPQPWQPSSSPIVWFFGWLLGLCAF